MHVFKKNNYVCLFPWLVNHHAIKCTGQIVNTIAERNNINGYILTFKNDDYSTFEKYCPKTNIVCLKKYIRHQRYGDFFNVLMFIMFNARKIDRLYLYHFVSDHTLMPIIGNIYKFLNNKGFLHIRLEAEPDLLPSYFPKISGNKLSTKIKTKIVVSFYKKANLIGTVDNEYFTTFKKKYLWQIVGNRLKNQFNGYRFFLETQLPPTFDGKKNYIVLAARLDAPQKGFDVFLEAIKEVNLGDWKILLLGNLTESQKQQIKEIESICQQISGKIVIKGHIEDIAEYAKCLNESKIFCLPSRNDGIPLVVPEALARGCVLVSSDLFCIEEVVIDHGKYGFSFINGDSKDLANVLNKLISQPDIIKEMSAKSTLRAKEMFHWNSIVDSLGIE